MTFLNSLGKARLATYSRGKLEILESTENPERVLPGRKACADSYGSRKRSDQSIIAVKVINVDKSDYKVAPVEKDQAMRDFFNEIQILQTLKDAKAKNINLIHEALHFHGQLWIVSEYCPGGSVHTLMRATSKPGLEERFIIAIARELAIALKFVHDAGIIHRDIKCGNILITQDGQLQLCDFGVSGALETNASKRSTMVGTPFWMAPEVLNQTDGYGREIDVWAYGCTVYEMAKGIPPNANINPHKLHLFMDKAPQLEGEEFSYGLREFVAYCLITDPKKRPDAESIQKHQFIANTTKKCPTSSLRELIERYMLWEQSGGNRASLWQPGGAATMARTTVEGETMEADEWNFNTTDDFTDEVLSRFAQPDNDLSRDPLERPRAPGKMHMGWAEEIAQRGGAKMARLFDENAQPYKYDLESPTEEKTDLAFRRTSRLDDDEDMIIDMDMARMSRDVSSITPLADVSTIRAKKSNFIDLYKDDEEEEEEPRYYPDPSDKRDTKDWSFSSALEQRTMPAPSNSKRAQLPDWSMGDAHKELEGNTIDRAAPPQRPQLMHTTTEPIGSFGDFLHPNASDEEAGPMLSFEPPDRDSFVEYMPRESFVGHDKNLSSSSRRPSTASMSSAGYSSTTDMSDGNPFALEDGNDRTIRGKHMKYNQTDTNRLSLHVHSQSEPVAADRNSGELLAALHNRGNSTSDLEPERPSPFDSEDLMAHTRNISVQSSIASLRRDTDSDDYFENGFMSQLRAQRQGEPLLSMQSRGLNSQNWNRYEHRRSETNQSFESDAATSFASDTDDYNDYRRSSQHGYATPPLSRQTSRRGRRGFESDADSDLDGGAYYQSSHRYRPQHQHAISFPKPQPPNADALDDDASADVVAEELNRLLNGLISGLDAAKSVLEENQHGRQSSQGYLSGHARGRESGSGSGSGPELRMKSKAALIAQAQRGGFL